MKDTRNTRYWFPAILRGCLVLVVIALPLSCDMFLGGDNGSAGTGSGVDTGDDVPPGNVRLQGRLGGLVTSAGIERSSLSSAVVNVAAISVVAGNANIAATREVEVSQEDGSFSVDLEPEDSADYVLLVNAPEEGDGVEQSLGFIALPAGNETSAGWPLSGSDPGTTIDVGTASGGGSRNESFLPDAETDELYALLNADEAELLFQAQRDNFLRTAQNDYLNRNMNVVVLFSYHYYTLNSRNTIVNRWPSSEEVLSALNSEYSIWIDPAPDVSFTVPDLLDGTIPVTMTPPADVSVDGGEIYSENDPLQNQDFGWQGSTEEDQAIREAGGFTVSLLDAPPEGVWTLEVGTERGAFDFFLTRATDTQGRFFYFFPVTRLNVDESTNRIHNLQIRWTYWNPSSGEYEFVPESFGFPPIVDAIDVNMAGMDDTAVDLEYRPDGSYEPQSTIYVTDPPDGGIELMAIDATYTLGNVPMSFTIWK